MQQKVFRRASIVIDIYRKSASAWTHDTKMYVLNMGLECQEFDNDCVKSFYFYMERVYLILIFDYQDKNIYCFILYAFFP